MKIFHPKIYFLVVNPKEIKMIVLESWITISGKELKLIVDLKGDIIGKGCIFDIPGCEVCYSSMPSFNDCDRNPPKKAKK